jgi:signal peptide peptidase SppA
MIPKSGDRFSDKIMPSNSKFWTVSMTEPTTDVREAGLGATLRSLRQWLPPRFRGDAPIVPVVRLSGVIGAVTPLRQGMTLASVARILERAFGVRGAKAVAIVVNSPGGSPVQSHQIHNRIRQLATEKKLPVLMFVEDVAASGGYMIACAGDEIFCDPSSIVGSIGVVGGSFGFQGLIEKIGVERRLYTSGKNKAMLDPFLPENPDDVARLKAIQHEIHVMFIDLVKKSRGAKIKDDGDELFSGAYWTGQKSIDLGLSDSIGDLRTVLRARFGEKVKMPVIAPASGLLSSLFGRRSAGMEAQALLNLPSSMPDELISALETRAIWARYGF